ncbi:hypothetical protein BGX23_008328 [Mortierella sp. AD031]|nr:hypothetical protein BGX23_008328 [Mortierella sp. AD031]
MKAGETINVRFFASGMKSSQINSQPAPTSPNRQFSQARHGGGQCEFSISYDNGKTFHLIGRYTRTCPDAYYRWPVKIPDNIPSCTEKEKCLFVWTWTAHMLPQWYMNCADIRLQGAKKNAKFPKESIQIVDFKPHRMRVTASGDGSKHRSSTGPNRSEINNNMNGRY